MEKRDYEAIERSLKKNLDSRKTKRKGFVSTITYPFRSFLNVLSDAVAADMRNLEAEGKHSIKEPYIHKQTRRGGRKLYPRTYDIRSDIEVGKDASKRLNKPWVIDEYGQKNSIGSYAGRFTRIMVSKRGSSSKNKRETDTYMRKALSQVDEYTKQGKYNTALEVLDDMLDEPCLVDNFTRSYGNAVEKRLYRLAKVIDSKASSKDQGIYSADISTALRAIEYIKEYEAEILRLHEDQKMDRRQFEGSLESKFVFIIAVIGIIAGIFLLSSNITGNVVGNSFIGSTITNIFGIVLFIFGLVGLIFYFNKK
jgi:hypothetical protein